MVYCFFNKNPITRRHILKSLMAKGYNLLGNNQTIDCVDRRYSAPYWNQIIVLESGVVDLMNGYTQEEISQLWFCKGGVKFLNYRQLSLLPPAGNVMDSMIPKIERFKFEYTPERTVEEQTYTVYGFTENTNSLFTAYADGHGVRTFIKAKVKNFRRID